MYRQVRLTIKERNLPQLYKISRWDQPVIKWLFTRIKLESSYMERTHSENDATVQRHYSSTK